MKIAKWNPETQTPHDIREFGSLKAGNGVPLKDWTSYTARGYYEYIPVALAEGEGLDNPTYALFNGVISQGGTVVSAQEMAARAQAARHESVAKMVTDYGADVAILGRQLAKFADPETGEPYVMPCDAGRVLVEIRAGLATGAIPASMIDEAKTLKGLYKDLKEHMTDADIAVVASVIGGAV